MRYLDILWQMIMNMLHHDFQARYGRPPEVITLDDLEAGLGPGGFEVVDEIHPILTHFVEHKITSRRGYPDDSSSDDESEASSITVPVMDRMRYLQHRDEYSSAIIIESKVKLNDDGVKQGTSKM